MVKLNRVLVKLSGEALIAPDGYWLNPQTLTTLAEDLVAASKAGYELAVVIGGGNVIRGAKVGAAGWIDRATADAMGMLATVMNSIALESAIEDRGAAARTMSAVAMPTICETYARQPALHHLKKQRIVVLGGGTGNPFFTTDTAAALRALEIHADAILMAKNGVEGVFDSDPAENPDAVFIPELTHLEAIERGLKIMDSTALSLCMDHDVPIHVFNMGVPGNMGRIVAGEKVGTIVTAGSPGGQSNEEPG